MSKSRIRLVQFTASALIFVLLGKMFYYQVVMGEKYARVAADQRLLYSTIERLRGNILDKNSIPFTHRDKKTYILLKPLYLKGRDGDIKAVCDILGLDESRIRERVEREKTPILVHADEEVKKRILKLDIPGASAITLLERYNEKTLAKHVLGYLNLVDGTGEAGIEKSYEETLRHRRVNSVGVLTDARENLLEGLGYRLFKDEESDDRLNVRLTLDYHIQKIVEEVMEKHRMTGAVIVEDIYTGDIVAMASKPDFDPRKVEDYLGSTQNELFNRAVASYNLGSIFKIIDVSVAIEKGFDPEQVYYCPGYVKVGDREFKCISYDRGGHGYIDMAGAFAKSCNSYFIQMCIDLGCYREIIEKAKEFGLGSATGIEKQGVAESSGNLPDPYAYHSHGDIANISIGQGEVLATPLQVVDMVAAIANGGIRNRVNIADAVVDRDGNRIRNLKVKDAKRVISRETAEVVKKMMERVVTEGTGTNAMLEKYGGSAGKTGSAEAGFTLNGEKVVHAWFAGYFPKRAPRYAMVVFVENGKVGNDTAAPVFADIAEEMMKMGF